MTDSIDYYDKNAEEFIAGTIDVDMKQLYARFLRHIPDGGHILDAGCGSGRDSKYFLDQGYQVTAFDGSEEMAAAASELTGLMVQQKRFDEVYCRDVFDGIWACASVLHVPKTKIADVINLLRAALKEQGVLYLSFKHGNGEEIQKGRHFSNYTEESFQRVLSSCNPLRVLELWTTADVRPYRQDELWLNMLLQRRR